MWILSAFQPDLTHVHAWMEAAPMCAMLMYSVYLVTCDRFLPTCLVSLALNVGNLWWTDYNLAKTVLTYTKAKQRRISLIQSCVSVRHRIWKIIYIFIYWYLSINPSHWISPDPSSKRTEYKTISNTNYGAQTSWSETHSIRCSCMANVALKLVIFNGVSCSVFSMNITTNNITSVRCKDTRRESRMGRFYFVLHILYNWLFIHIYQKNKIIIIYQQFNHNLLGGKGFVFWTRTLIRVQR